MTFWAVRSFWTLVSPKSLDEIKARYDFELSKAVRVGVLRDKLTEDQQLRASVQKNVNIAGLVGKKEYVEGDFGFIRREDEWLDEDDEERTGTSYMVFLKVPEHVLKTPEDYVYHDGYDGIHKLTEDRYYLFDKTRVAVRVFLDDSGEIAYDVPLTVEKYEHPFMMQQNRICIGDYDFGKLDGLKREEAVARLLTDTRKILLSCYISAETSPARRLTEFEKRRLTLAQVKKRNLPITNIKIEKGRRNK